MYCTRCGIELREQDKFCNECGTSTGRGAPPCFPKTDRLSRSTTDAKVAGVCAGFAKHFGLDVTLVRIVWLILCVWPVPLFGVIAYIVAWIVMPKDVVTSPATEMQPVNRPTA